MRFEYMFITQPFQVSWADLTALVHAQELNRAFGAWLPTIQPQLDEAAGGGWELVSHDLLRLDDGLVLSVLARRVASSAGIEPSSFAHLREN